MGCSPSDYPLTDLWRPSNNFVDVLKDTRAKLKKTDNTLKDAILYNSDQWGDANSNNLNDLFGYEPTDEQNMESALSNKNGLRIMELVESGIITVSFLKVLFDWRIRYINEKNAQLLKENNSEGSVISFKKHEFLKTE